MKVTMIGTGYVGLVSGTCFADFGIDVTCCDNDAAKIATLAEGGVPFYEPGLAEKIVQNVAAGRLAFTTDVGAAIRAADVIFIAVGTPARQDGSTDLTYIDAVADEIGLDADRFARDLNSEAIETQMQDGFNVRRSLNANEFPSLVMQDGDQVQFLVRGYDVLEGVLQKLQTARR